VNHSQCDGVSKRSADVGFYADCLGYKLCQ
jgi:hypothetical protein